MNIQLQQAFEGAYKLPLFEQNILADALMATIRNYELFADDETQWDELFQSKASQQWLEKMATQVEMNQNWKRVDEPKTDWKRIDAMTDEDIDLSDCQELDEDFFEKALLSAPDGTYRGEQGLMLTKEEGIALQKERSEYDLSQIKQESTLSVLLIIGVRVKLI